MRRGPFNLKISIIIAAITAVTGIVLVILTQVNFLGDLVLGQLTTAISHELNVELQMSPLSGNPIMGFKGGDVIFVQSGDKLLTVDEIEIKLSLPSLIKNSPRVAVLTINGAKSDYELLKRLIPKRKDPSGSKDIPIDKIRMNNFEMSSKLGLLKFDDSSLELRGTEWFAPVFRGTVAGTPFFISGILKKTGTNWGLDGFSLKLDKGTAKISGTVFPNLDFSSEIKDLDLNLVDSFLPAAWNHGLGWVLPPAWNHGLSGMLSGTCEVKGSGRDITVLGKGTLKDAIIEGVPLAEVAAEWNYDKGLFEMVLAESRVFKSTLTGKMKLDMRTSERYLELKLSAENLRFTDWTDKTGMIIKNVSEKITPLHGGITNLKADLKGPLNALVGKIEIAPSNVSYNKIDFSNLHGSAVFDGKPAGSVDFSADYQGKKVTLAGIFSFADGVQTNLELSVPSLKLDNMIGQDSSLKKYNLHGNVGFSGHIEGLIGNLILKGKVSSSSVEIDKIGKIINLKAGAEYSFKDLSFLLKNISGFWNGAEISGSGTAKHKAGGIALSFGGNLKKVSIEKFYDTLPFFKNMNIDANVFGTWRVDGTSKSPRILLKLNASNGRFRNLKVDKFHTEMLYSSGVLVFNSMEVKAGVGTGILKCKVVLPKTVSDKGVKKPGPWELTGKVKNIDLSALNGLLKLSQDIEGPCTGDIKVENSGSGMQWSANLSGKKIRWKQFSADEANGLITGDSKVIRIEGVKVKFLRGEHTVKGKVVLAEKGKPISDSILDVTVTSNKINMYELLRRHLPVIRGVQGLIQSNIAVGGTLGSPSYKGNGTLEPFRYRGFLLPMVDVDFNGNLTEINISKANARMQAGQLTGKGRVYLVKGEWHAELDTSGSDIDLKQVGAYLPDNFRERLGGKADFQLEGSGKVVNFHGEGSFKAKSMRFLGVRLENVNAPFYIADGYAVMEDVKAATNGGAVTGGLAMDLNKSRWGGNLTVLSADVKPMLKQAFPNLKGTFSGKGDLKVRASGETGRMSTVRSVGAIFLHDGEIADFDAVEAARKYTKGKPLLYKTMQVAFTSDGGYLTILPGSQSVAPAGDPVYRYVMIDGLISKDRNLSLFAMGKVNIRALNALLGALQGIVNVGMDFTGAVDTNALLHNFLGGVLSGFTRTDFRFVTLNINGTVMSPTFSNIKVDRSSQIKQGKDLIPKSASDPADKDFTSDDTIFRLRFEIPVGPGVSNTPNSVEGQVLEQTLENLLQGINFGQ